MQTAVYIKSKVGMFSSLNSEQRFTIAAMLDVQFADPKDKLNQLLECYDVLKSFRYIQVLRMIC